MDCSEILFSGHAVRRMFERSITAQDVAAVIRAGETIATYPDDTPFPSALLLGWSGTTPLHVVVARDESTLVCHIITVNVPAPELWDDGFRFRRIP